MKLNNEAISKGKNYAEARGLYKGAMTIFTRSNLAMYELVALSNAITAALVVASMKTEGTWRGF